MSPCPNPLSPRMCFQWKYFDRCYPDVLNIGCADDPLMFGSGAHHFDLDDWSYLHRRFTQGDAANLPFEDASWKCVILGDVLEHVVDPLTVAFEAARVTALNGYLVMTVFEEWKLPGYGQYIKEGRENSDRMSRELGYEDRIDYQVKNFPEKIGYDDEEIPHLIHINQFSDTDMQTLAMYISGIDFEILELLKAFEVNHEGHDIYNWLLAFRRTRLRGESLPRSNDTAVSTPVASEVGVP